MIRDSQFVSETPAAGEAVESRAFLHRGIAFTVFFASGFAALSYQVIWQRLLLFFSGADVYSVTLIVTAFMAGLAWWVARTLLSR